MLENLIPLIILTVIIIIFIIWVFLTLRLFNLKKRLEAHVISKTDNYNLSIIDKLINYYQKKKSNFIKKLISNQKRAYTQDKLEEINSNFSMLINQIFISISMVIIYLIISILKLTSFSLTFLVFIFLLGFYIPIGISVIKKEIVKKQMESDLLKAVSIMNHAFISGSSMLQAIELVSIELDGPLGLEFSKIHNDIVHGLGINVAFNRFSERVNISDVKYITDSLTILDKTGGNVVEVFSSIEDNLITRKELDIELDTIIASSKLIFKLLAILPIFLVVIISLFSPSYFQILLNSPIGIFILVLIISIYILYIIIIYNIMEVDKY